MGALDKITKIVKEVSPIPIPEVTFSQVVKQPVVYLLILACIACGFLLDQFVVSKKDQNNDCSKELLYWKDAFTNERTINKQITNILLTEHRNFVQYKDSTSTQTERTKKTLTNKSHKLLTP